jgi:hypothetical protein
MGPAPGLFPETDPIPGREDMGTQWTDYVVRMHLFIREHPHVAILSPRISGTGEWLATWIEASPNPAEDGVTQRAGHERLGSLMSHLEARFGGPA